MSVLAVITRPTDQDADDLDLVAGLRAGDDRAFELLFLRYQPRIAAYVQRMVGDHGRAEDITQEVFIAALRRLRETEREIVFKPWIYEIAKNACIDAFRRSRGKDEVSFDARDALSGDDVGRLVQQGATPDSLVEGKVAFDNFCGAFGGLSRAQHEILVLREFEGLSYREIGERLGMSRPAVESTLFRARRRLSEEYKDLVSGARCLRVQRIVDVDAGGASATGLRDRRRLARHLAHCQPCRRYARLAGVDVDAVAKRSATAAKAARIAALLPLPLLLRRRADAEVAGQLLGQQGGAPVAQWSANVAGALDPALFAGWTKSVATAAAVAVAGVGAGAAITERDALHGFIARVPAVTPGPSSAGSGPAERGRGDSVRRRAVNPPGARLPQVRVKSVTDRVRGGGASPGVTADVSARPLRSLRELGRSDELSSGPRSSPDRGAAFPRQITGITAQPKPAPPPGIGAAGQDATGDATTSATRDRQEAVRRLIDKLRGGDGGGGGGDGAAGAGADGRPGTPAKGAAPAPQAPPGTLASPPAATGSAGAPATPPIAPVAPTPAARAGTDSGVPAVPTAPSPAKPPS